MLIETKHRIGLMDKDWLEFTFDLSEVVWIKKDWQSEYSAVCFKNGLDVYLVEIKYNELSELWKQQKQMYYKEEC